MDKYFGLINKFEYYKEKNLVYFDKIKLDNGVEENCIFMDDDIINDNHCINPLMFLYDVDLSKYILKKKYFDTDGYSFGLNNYYNLTLIQMNNKINPIDKIKLYYKIKTDANMFRHIDLYHNNLTSIEYSFNAWIEYNNQVIYNFRKIKLKNKTRLFLYKQYISVFINPLYKTYLVIEIPKEKEEDWKQIYFSFGNIFSLSEFKKKLLSYNKKNKTINFDNKDIFT